MVKLLDVVHADQKLYMVFEYLDKDLKRFMDEFEPVAGCPGIPENIVKVRVNLSDRELIL